MQIIVRKAGALLKEVIIKGENYDRRLVEIKLGVLDENEQQELADELLEAIEELTPQ